MVADSTYSHLRAKVRSWGFTVLLPEDRRTVDWNDKCSFEARKWKMVQQFPFCFYCGKAVIPGGRPDDRPTVEHLRPKVHGGTKGNHNLVLCCYGCNQTRKIEPFSRVAVSIVGERRLILLPDDDGEPDEAKEPAPLVETAVYSRRQWLVRRAVRRLLTVAVSLLLIVAEGGAV